MLNGPFTDYLRSSDTIIKVLEKIDSLNQQSDAVPSSASTTFVGSSSAGGPAVSVVTTVEEASKLSAAQLDQIVLATVDKLLKVPTDQRPRRMKAFINVIAPTIAKVLTMSEKGVGSVPDAHKWQVLEEMRKRNMIFCDSDKVQFLF